MHPSLGTLSVPEMYACNGRGACAIYNMLRTRHTLCIGYSFLLILGGVDGIVHEFLQRVQMSSGSRDKKKAATASTIHPG